MKIFKSILLSLFCICTIVTINSCKRKGCTDPIAKNYDPKAKKNRGCDYGDCWTPTENQINFIKLEEHDTSSPSNVSIFFKLEDNQELPIPNLTEDSFTFYEQGLINDICPTFISEDEANRKIQNSPQTFRYSTILVLDLSGSVVNNHLDDLKEASIKFIEEVIPDTPDSGFEMGIWWFDGNANLHELTALTDDRLQLINSVNSITSSLPTDNSTNLYGAVVQATEIVENIENNLPENLISSSSIVFFTDGEDRAQIETKNNAYSTIDNAPPNITFFAIGLGSEINEEDLRKFGRDGLERLDESDIESLVTTFAKVGELVIAEAGSYYIFEYCSPLRNGEARLVIEVSINGQIGFMQFDYSASGFTSGCNL